MGLIMKVSDESTILNAMQSAHQSGIVARASRQLIECRTLDSFLYCAHRTLQDLGCSGFAQFQCGEESRHIKFGDTARLHQRVAQQGSAIYVNNIDAGQFTYRAEKILLIIDIEYCNPREGDILKDNVAIFADSMAAWLACHAKSHQGVPAPMVDIAGAVDGLNNVTNSLCRINDELLEGQRHVCEDLLSPLLAGLPVLGLCVEQENKILGIVNQAIEGGNKLHESHISRNIELRKLVSYALFSLCPPKKDLNTPSYMDSDTLLFD